MDNDLEKRIDDLEKKLDDHDREFKVLEVIVDKFSGLIDSLIDNMWG